MDSKTYRKQQVEAARLAEEKFQQQIHNLKDQFGTELEIPLPLRHVRNGTDGPITRALAKATLKDGTVLDPVLLLPADQDPRLLWFPDRTYMYDNTTETTYHDVIPKILVGGQVKSLAATSFAIPTNIISDAENRIGFGSNDPTVLEVSCKGKYGYGVLPDSVFADWGEVRGQDIDVNSGREPQSVIHVRHSRCFLADAVVVLCSALIDTSR